MSTVAGEDPGGTEGSTPTFTQPPMNEEEYQNLQSEIFDAVMQEASLIFDSEDAAAMLRETLIVPTRNNMDLLGASARFRQAAVRYSQREGRPYNASPTFEQARAIMQTFADAEESLPEDFNQALLELQHQVTARKCIYDGVFRTRQALYVEQSRLRLRSTTTGRPEQTDTDHHDAGEDEENE